MKKRLNNLIAAAATVSLFSWGAITLANDSVAIVGPTSSAQKNENKKFFFTISSKNTEFRFLSDKTYQLVIPKNEITFVNAVSVRPYRELYNLKPEEYAKRIHRGEESFDAIPPNLSICFFDTKVGPISFSVASYESNEKNITFTLTALGEQNHIPNHASGQIGLWIDDQGLDIANFGPQF
jgi:hypothetical protein